MPIRLFGIFSAIGVAASLLLLMLFLPAVWSMFPGASKITSSHDEPPAPTSGTPSRIRLLGQGVLANHGWITAAGLLLLGIGAYGATKVQSTVKVEKFFSRQAQVIQHYRWLEEKLAPLVPMEVVIRVDRKVSELNMLEQMNVLEEVEANLRQLDYVGSTVSAVTFAPSLDTSGSNREWLARSVLNKRLDRARDEFVQSGYFSENPDEQLWRISLRVEALNDVDYGHFVQEISERVAPAIDPAKDPAKAGVTATYTGMVPLVFKAQRGLLEGVVFGFGTDLLLIVIAVIFLTRHWSSGILLMLTSVFPALIVFGFMGWRGIIVDVGTVMTPGVALGVTVDDVVHFLLWFRRGVAKGLERPQAVMLAYRGCGRAMYQSWGVLGLGLAVFGLSDFVPTQRFGLLMVALLTAGLVGNLVFLPALLAGPLGGIFARGVAPRRKAKAKSSPQPSEQVIAEAPLETFGKPKPPKPARVS